MLGVLEQPIEGGGNTIGSLTSTTVKDLVSYYHHYFPQESCDCIVGLVGLMGSITDVVVSQEDVEHQSMVCSK